MLRYASIALTSLVTMVSSLPAGLITLDLLDPTGTGNTAGEAFNLPNSFFVSGVTFDASTTTTLGTGTSSFSSNTSNAGVDSDGITSGGGDSASELDAGETLKLTLTFDAAAWSVALANVDLSGVGGSTDAATVTTPAGTFDLFTGQPDFNGSTDVWSPSGLTFASGQMIQFETNDRISVPAITFDITAIAVPEPSAFLFMAIVAAPVCAAAAYRKRKMNRRSDSAQ